MALFYDRDHNRGWHRSYDRGYRGRSGWGDYEGGYDYGGRAMNRGYDRGYQGDFEGRGFRGDRYDAGYKSRWQTDYGDPFNDRGSRTPFRMTRGEYRGGEPDRGWSNDYDRDFSANPMGYDPYYDQPRPGPFARGRWWGEGRNRYDEGWF